MKDIAIKKIKPLHTSIVTTCAQWETDGMSDGLIDTDKQSGIVKPFQKVVAVGPMVRNINVGDLVEIDPTRFMKKRYMDGSLKDGAVAQNEAICFEFPLVEVNNEVCMLLNENDIKYVIEEYDEVEVHALEGEQDIVE